MARPAPTVIFTFQSKNGLVEDVTQAAAIYAVFHDGQPIGLRTTTKGGILKYPRTAFSNAGHAFNLAERLNEQLDTDLFAVHELVMGSEVEEIKAAYTPVGIRRK